MPSYRLLKSDFAPITLINRAYRSEADSRYRRFFDCNGHPPHLTAPLFSGKGTIAETLPT